MQVVCEVMRLREDAVDEYLKMHENTWPELVSAIRASGFVEEYIFLIRNLVMVVLKSEDYRASSAQLAATDVFQRWTTLVRGLLIEDRELFGSAEKVVPLDPIWRLSDFEQGG